MSCFAVLARAPHYHTMFSRAGLMCSVAVAAVVVSMMYDTR